MSCDLCEQIDPNLPNTTNAKNLGVAESTIRRHKAHMTDAFFSDIPVHAITQRRTTKRLPDGSYERVTWSPAKASAQLLAYDDLEAALTGYTSSPPARGFGFASVLNLADLQIGKTDWNGGTKETLAKVHRAVDTFVEKAKKNHPSAVVLVDNGDGIENLFNTPTQRITNDLDVPAQMRTFRRLMIEVLKKVANLAPVIYYVTVTSNHGAFRTDYKTQGGTSDADFGLEIAEQLRDVCVESIALRHVRFVTPKPMQEVTELEVAGTKIAFTHGHLSNSNKDHAAWWARIDHGRLPGWDADLMVTAHYHTLSVQQSGDGRWIIGVSSADPGSSWFTKKTGESAVSGVTTFDVCDGKWYNLEIL